LAVDVGLRYALVNGRPLEEIRGGVTFGFPLSFGGAKASQTAQK
jgi:hypothetical protein